MIGGLSLVLLAAVAARNSPTVLDTFMVTSDRVRQKEAFLSLLKAPPRPPAIRAWLDRAYASSQNERRDRILYLVARLRPSGLGRRLFDLVSKSEDTGERCIYTCAEGLALALYAVFGKELTEANLRAAGPVGDEVSRLTAIRKNPAPSHAQIEGLAVDALVKRAARMSEPELVQEATDESKDHMTRYIALEELSASVTSADHLDDFYWLALTMPDDDSGETHLAIFGAILRAEVAAQARRRK